MTPVSDKDIKRKSMAVPIRKEEKSLEKFWERHLNNSYKGYMHIYVVV